MTNQELEQALAELRDGMPRMWYALYQGCLETGFSPDEAMELVKAFIAGNPMGGKK